MTGNLSVQLCLETFQNWNHLCQKITNTKQTLEVWATLPLDTHLVLSRIILLPALTMLSSKKCLINLGNGCGSVVEQMLPTPEVRCSKLVSGKFYWVSTSMNLYQKMNVKKKRLGMSHFLKCSITRSYWVSNRASSIHQPQRLSIFTIHCPSYKKLPST